MTCMMLREGREGGGLRDGRGGGGHNRTKGADDPEDGVRAGVCLIPSALAAAGRASGGGGGGGGGCAWGTELTQSYALPSHS